MANNTTELNISVQQAGQHGGITMISKYFELIRLC